MDAETRIRTLLSATPDQLAAVDAALAGRHAAPPPCLRLLKMGEAAEQTGLSRVTLWRAIRDGRLQAIEVRDNSRRVSLAELQRFVAGH